MDITLYYTTSEPNRLEKKLSSGNTLNGNLRNESNILNPNIVISFDGNITDYNYAYISQFERYYFISDIVSIRNNIWELRLKVDVLMSFASGIKHSTGVIEKAVFEPGTPYINANGFVPLVKKKTDIISFPNGFNENGEFILITAGGFAT